MRPRKVKDYDEDGAHGNVEAYGEEEDDEGEGLGKRVKRKSARQQMSSFKMAEDEGEISGEERYGLRDRKKRVKND